MYQAGFDDELRTVSMNEPNSSYCTLQSKQLYNLSLEKLTHNKTLKPQGIDGN